MLMLKVLEHICALTKWSKGKRARAAKTDNVVKRKREKGKERPQNLNRRQKLDKVKLHCKRFA